MHIQSSYVVPYYHMLIFCLQQKYIDMAAEDVKRFRKALKAVGIEPPPSTSA